MVSKKNKIKRKLIGFMAGEKGAIGKLQALALGITGLIIGGLPTKTVQAWWSGDWSGDWAGDWAGDAWFNWSGNWPSDWSDWWIWDNVWSGNWSGDWSGDTIAWTPPDDPTGEQGWTNPGYNDNVMFPSSRSGTAPMTTYGTTFPTTFWDDIPPPPPPTTPPPTTPPPTTPPPTTPPPTTPPPTTPPIWSYDPPPPPTTPPPYNDWPVDWAGDWPANWTGDAPPAVEKVETQ